MKKVIVLLIGLALALAVGLAVYRAIGQFAFFSSQESTGMSSPQDRVASAISSSAGQKKASDDKMIQWKDIESSLALQEASGALTH